MIVSLTCRRSRSEGNDATRGQLRAAARYRSARASPREW